LHSVGGGGFVAPQNKPNYGSNPNTGSGGLSVGGGGFVAPKKNNFGTNYGSNYGQGKKYGHGGVDYGGVGYTAYNLNQGWSNRWKGNHFGSSSVGSYGRKGGLFGGGKKTFALAAGAGFVGGAVAGVYGMQMYHRYKMYQSMMYHRHHGGYGYGGGGGGYGPHGYGFRNTECFGGCPIGAFCDYGMCRCRPNYEDLYGRCWNSQDQFTSRQSEWDKRMRPDFEPFIACSGHEQCLDIDMNMFCSTSTNKCQCRDSTKWNKEELECQLFMDVDCSSTRSGGSNATTAATPSESNPITTSTTTAQPDSGNLTISDDEEDDDVIIPDVDLNNRTIVNVTAGETLVDSGLLNLDLNKTTESEIKEQFCFEMKALSQKYTRREIDPYRNDRIGETAVAIGAAIIALIVFIVCCICCCAVFICKKVFCSRKPNLSQHSHSSSDDKMAGNHEEPPPVGYNPYTGQITTGQPQPVPTGGVMPPVPGQPAVAAAPGYDAPPPYAPYPQPPPGSGAYPPQAAYPPAGYPPDGSAAPPYPPAGAGVPYPQQAYPPNSTPYPPAP